MIIISDLDHLEECDGINLAGGLFDIGGSGAKNNNANTASFSNLTAAAIGDYSKGVLLTPTIAINNIVLTQVLGSANPSIL